jgi:heme iron utilization protein
MPNSEPDSARPPLPGTMPDRLPEGATPPADFNPVVVAKELLRGICAGTLATLDRHTGHPFASLVNIATDADGSPVILVSRLSTHTANIEVDGRASILLAAVGKGDPLAHPRLTTLGVLEKNEEPRLRRRFLARHPKAKLYAGFADFSFWRLAMVSAHLNGGFARAADLVAKDVLTDLTGAGELIDAEDGAIAHMNADHADAVRLYATRLLGEPDGRWQVTGIDPDGLDLAMGDRTARLAFAERVTGAAQLRAALKHLADRARGP